jgi:hypothetical protein
MAKGLVKNIASLLAIGGFLFALNWRPKYDIDNSRVKNGNFFFNGLIEYKEGRDKIKYSRIGAGEEVNVIINGREYYSDTTPQYQEGNKRYDYLMGKIDSINIAKDKLRAQEQLEKRMKKAEKREERANMDLEVLRK